MTLREKQSLFAAAVGLLIAQAYWDGYEITFGEAYRPPETAALYAEQGRGIKNSLHCSRLAVDLNLFRDGKYLTDTEDYRDLGEWWEELTPLARWGGNFSRPDGNHFSFTHGGRA